MSTMSRGTGEPLRVVVDLNLCQGYAQCVFAAPDHFWLHGPEALAYHPMPEAGERDRILRAVAACPVQAIHVEDTDASA